VPKAFGFGTEAWRVLALTARLNSFTATSVAVQRMDSKAVLSSVSVDERPPLNLFRQGGRLIKQPRRRLNLRLAAKCSPRKAVGVGFFPGSPYALTVMHKQLDV
jgi:hypothetical protein